MGKSKRNSPKPGGNRAQRLAERRAAQEQAAQIPARPFAGLAAECDLVALREFVPSATATLKLSAEVAAQRPVTLATVLPGAVAPRGGAAGAPPRLVAAPVHLQYGAPPPPQAPAGRWTQPAP
uniref:DUF5926 family protein n=1 Tax=Nocardia wallacei TaxID=480035 RepID=UPI002454996F